MGLTHCRDILKVCSFNVDGSFIKHINRTNRLGSKGVIAENFATLMRSMKRAEETVVAPIKFKQILGDYAPQFQGNDQQDSQEFLAFLLDAIHEDLNMARPNPNLKNNDEDDTNPVTAWNKYKYRNWSIIVDMFQGQLRSVVQCLTCATASTTFNTFMYLSLPIPTRNKNGVTGGAVYLDDCIEKFVEIEILDGDDKWFFLVNLGIVPNARFPGNLARH